VRVPRKRKGLEPLERRLRDCLPLADAEDIADHRSLVGGRTLMQPEHALVVAILSDGAECKTRLRRSGSGDRRRDIAANAGNRRSASE
jgi:hypothetical protein